MDAKQRAQFINAQNTRQADSGQSPRICPNCHAEVKGKFCTKCGTKYEEPVQEAQQPIPEPKPVVPVTEERAESKPVVSSTESGPVVSVKEEKPAVPEVSPAAEKIVKRDRKAPRRSFTFHPAPIQMEETEEEASALAQGLPEWSVEPPQVMVRRKRR